MGSYPKRDMIQSRNIQLWMEEEEYKKVLPLSATTALDVQEMIFTSWVADLYQNVYRI